MGVCDVCVVCCWLAGETEGEEKKERFSVIVPPPRSIFVHYGRALYFLCTVRKTGCHPQDCGFSFAAAASE